MSSLSDNSPDCVRMEAAVVSETGWRERDRGEGDSDRQHTNINTQLAVRANTRQWLHTCTFALTLTIMLSAGFTSCDSCDHAKKLHARRIRTKSTSLCSSSHRRKLSLSHLLEHVMRRLRSSWYPENYKHVPCCVDVAPVCLSVCMCVKLKQAGSVWGVCVRSFLRSASGYRCAHRPPSRPRSGC